MNLMKFCPRGILFLVLIEAAVIDSAVEIEVFGTFINFKRAFHSALSTIICCDKNGIKLGLAQNN